MSLIVHSHATVNPESQFVDRHVYFDQLGNSEFIPPFTNIDIGMVELHKYLKNWMITHPDMDAETSIGQALHERYPGSDMLSVLFTAECNQLTIDRQNMVRDANRNESKWIDTTVQGDLFNDLNDRVPRWIIGDDGKPVEYWKVSPVKILEYKQSILSGFIAEERAHLDSAALARQRIVTTEADIAKTERIITEARKNGIDPETVRYEKHD